MIVSELIEDLEAVLKEQPDSEHYQIGFKKSFSDEPVIYISSFHWDEEEFFIVAIGDEHYFELKPMKLSVGSFLQALKGINDKRIREFSVFARTGVARTPEGDNISMNLPVNGTAISDKTKTVYFFNQDAEEAAKEKQVYLLRIEATASVKGEKVVPGKRYAILSFVYDSKIHVAEMRAHHDLFKDGWKDVITEEKGPFDIKTLDTANSDIQKAYELATEVGVSALIFTDN